MVVVELVESLMGAVVRGAPVAPVSLMGEVDGEAPIAPVSLMDKVFEEASIAPVGLLCLYTRSPKDFEDKG